MPEPKSDASRRLLAVAVLAWVGTTISGVVVFLTMHSIVADALVSVVVACLAYAAFERYRSFRDG